MKICTRADCNKKLRKDNVKDVCASRCLSPDAPPAVRSAGVEAREHRATPGRRAPIELGHPGTALAKLRLVAEALGRDPAAEMEELAQGWLDALAERLNDA